MVPTCKFTAEEFADFDAKIRIVIGSMPPDLPVSQNVLVTAIQILHQQREIPLCVSLLAILDVHVHRLDESMAALVHEAASLLLDPSPVKLHDPDDEADSVDDLTILAEADAEAE